MQAAVPPIPVKPNPLAKKVLEHIHQQIVDRGSTALVLGDLFVEVEPPPTAPYAWNNPATHRYTMLTAQTLNAAYNLNLDPHMWNRLLDQVPLWVRQKFAEGRPLTPPTGWYATRVEPDTDNQPQEAEVGDIYYLAYIKTGTGALTATYTPVLHYFTVDQSHLTSGRRLVLHSDSESGWDTNQPVKEIIATLDPISVSVLSGTPLYLGWQQDLLTPDSFILKDTHSTDIFTRPFDTVTVETVAGKPFYHLFPAPVRDMEGIPNLNGFDQLQHLIGTPRYPTCVLQRNTLYLG